MNLFKRKIDQKPVIEMIRKVLQGIGQPNFDDGTGIQRQAEISNIVLEDKDVGKQFADLNIPMGDMEDMDFSDLNKTKLTFTLPSGDYIAKVDMNEFSLKRIAKEKIASIYNHFDKSELEVKLTGDNNKDEVAIKSLIKSFLDQDIKLFDAKSASTLNDTVMGLGYDGAYCLDREVGWLLFGFIAKQMHFLRPTEANLLIDIFMLDDKPIRFTNIESAMRLEMMQTFNILKENGHDIDNEVESNDMDNYLYYVEKGDIQGNVYTSQNNMFLVARNTKTNVIKVWNTMRVDDYWMDSILDDSKEDDDGNTVLNIAEYMQSFSNARYANNYDYPFEFNAIGYRKGVEKLLEEFETCTDDLVYDSELGFMPSQYMAFNSLALELSYSNSLMTDQYNVERDILVLTDMDINSPDYFIRSMTTNYTKSRSSALYHLFMISGTRIYWNGKTFVSASNVLEDYAPNEAENDYSPLKADRAFPFTCAPLFNLPSDLTPEWKKVAFEMAVYLTDWVKDHTEDKEALVYKDDLAKIFETHYDAEVFEKVQAAR